MRSEAPQKTELLNVFHSLTEEIGRLLADNDFDAAIDMLGHREKLLTQIQGQKNLAHWASKNSRMKSIMKMDEQNIEVLNKKMDEAQKNLATLEKEKQSVNNLRSIAKINHKKIVDFLY